jgi:F-type H+-transporting ATPase subunit b
MHIDWWTLGLQTVNVVILIWLLQRFFWTPVADMIAQRRVAVQKALADAQTARAGATAALADIEKTRAGFAVERQTVLSDARAEAERKGAALKTEAAAAAAALLATAKAAVADEKVEAAQAWSRQSSVLAVDIAKRLAARLDGPAVHDVFLNWALAAIRAAPTSTREAITTGNAALEATSATALAPADQTRAAQQIGEAFGAPCRVVFKVDPALIAGLELRADHLVVSNSWRADLAEIMTGLAHDAKE